MTPTTRPTLADLIDLRNAATPGPWETDSYADGEVTVQQDNAKSRALCIADMKEGATDRPELNAAFIAAAGSFDYEALAAELAALREALRGMFPNGFYRPGHWSCDNAIAAAIARAAREGAPDE